MKSKNISLVIRYAIIAVPVGALLWNCSGEPKKETVVELNYSKISWQMPVEVHDTTQVDYAILGWQSFIALNWPADTNYRGKPDTTKKTGTSSPVVWETFKLKEETFYPDTLTNPGPWNAASVNGKPRRSFAKKSLFRAAKSFDTIPVDQQGGEFNEAGTNVPLIDQDSNYVMYEIAINESEYTYIVNHNYFNGNVQKREVHAHSFTNPPKGDTLVTRSENGDSLYYQIAPSIAGLPSFAQYGSTEIKASWRVLPASMPAAQLQRYYHRTSVIALPQGGYRTAEVGLVGLHILRLSYITRNTWYWATFEQMDNVTVSSGSAFTPSFNPGGNPSYPNGYCYNSPACDSFPDTITNFLPEHSKPVNISRFTPIPSYIDSLNSVYQALLSGTVWQYYQMVGVVNQAVGSNKSFELPYPANTGIYTNVNMMANTTLESYAQNSSFGNPFSNCVSCHSFGFPQHDPADKAYVDSTSQIFTFLLLDASTTGASATKSEAVLRRQRMRGHK
ncbi:MAG: hypothetical protein M3R17_06210 [Bacteroidota bacterium]|nr:hypothetical protein [Bacteroidota bacterium]